MSRKNEFTERVDKMIGIKIHELRVTNGLSRKQLATEIGVTHQQLQKYENAVNRISAGRLASIASVLNKPIAFFFEDIEEKDKVFENEHQRMCIEVARNFLRIENPNYKSAVNSMIRALADR